jgi:hypothetical protein
MHSALDAFRAQREAADQVYARLIEVARLLEQLTKQVDAVAGNRAAAIGLPHTVQTPSMAGILLGEDGCRLLF